MKHARLHPVLPGLLALALSTAPLLAQAHPGHGLGAGDGLMAGFMHPLSGLDHLVALLGVGLWTALAARRGRLDLLMAPVALLAALLTGALLTQAGLRVPGVEPMVAVSLLGLGLAVSARGRGPRAASLPVVAAFAFFHGAAHGQELASLAALAGMTLAAAMLCAAGVAGGLVLRHRNRWLPRVAGAGIGLLGLSLLAGLAR